MITFKWENVTDDITNGNGINDVKYGTSNTETNFELL